VLVGCGGAIEFLIENALKTNSPTTPTTQPIHTPSPKTQSALERSAEDAMANAVARMNKAVEMVADAESKAAAAAATATMHQDVAEGQAAIAHAAADVPVVKSDTARSERAQRAGGVQALLHSHLFSAWSILAEAAGGAWASLVGVFVAMWAAIAAAVGGAVGAVTGVFGFGSRGSAPPAAV